MRKSIAISADTTCDLPIETIEKLGIHRIPLYITFGETSYLDTIEITPDEIYKKYAEEGVLPKTAAISVGDFIEYFGKLLEEAETVIHYSISSALSCTCQNAMLAAQEFDGKVFIVDSLNLSTGEGMSILRAFDLLEEGKTAEEIVADSEDYKTRIIGDFVVDDLEFLRKGGRCSALTAMGANLLNIKPCIEVKDGKLGVGKKYRGKYRAVLQKYTEERMADENVETRRVIITHAGCDDEIVDMVYQLVKDTNRFEEVLVSRAGCTISSHCGRNTLGMFTVRK